MKVVIADAIAPEGVEYLRAHACEVEVTAGDAGRLEAALPSADALVTRSSTAVTAALLARAPRLRIVGRAGVGVDNVDVDACSRRGVLVVNAPLGNVVSAAEHTLGMLLALVRRIPEAHTTLKGLQWSRAVYGTELAGKTIGIVGLGKVGSRVARRLAGFEAELLAYDPYVPESRGREAGVRLVALDELLGRADAITVHTPLTPETAGMLGAAALARCRPGVYVINCARGGIVDEAALLAALEAGHVAGAALDVWTEEPPRADTLRRLVGHPRVVVTPHLGANSVEAQANVALDVARQIVVFRDGVLPEFAVNVPVDAAAVAALRPFVALAERLGRFLVQLEPGRLERVELAVAGVLGESDPEVLLRAMLAGLLGPVVDEPVNIVNAHLVARARGLDAAAVRSDESHGYTSLLTVSARTADGRKSLAGTVFDGQPRIVRMRDLDMEFVPEGWVLVLSYEDRPGVVGRIGTILGRLGVNIASMTVGRREKRGRAIVVLALDEELTPGQVGEVAASVEADFARLVRLD